MLTDAERWEISVANTLAQPAFFELLEFASETCLERPERVIELANHAGEALSQSVDETTLASHFGVWGLRAAIELAENPETDAYSEDRSSRLRGFGEILAGSDYLSLVSDRKVQTHIEAFGKAVLEEAFECLGEDALTQTERYKNATEPKDQLEVFSWLLQRLGDIRDKHQQNSDPTIEANVEEVAELPLPHLSPVIGSVAEITGTVQVELEAISGVEVAREQAERFFYHPARLSPRLLGRHPDTRYEPTCLGLSVLAAAFFEKAGVAYMHAGVALTAVENAKLRIEELCNDINIYAQKLNILLPQPVVERFEKLSASITKSVELNRGHHAALLVRMCNGHWVQLDINFASNFIEEYPDIIQKRYDTLSDISASSPGVESMLSLYAGFGPLIFVSSLFETMDRPTPSDYDVTSTLVDAYLSEQPRDILHSYILGRLPDNEWLDVTTNILMKRQGFGGTRKVEYALETLDDMLLTYVFPDAKEGDLRPCLERCSKDENYLRCRVEDLKLVPFYFMLRLGTDLVNDLANFGNHNSFPAYALEVGLPRYRIGACVLSDFAVYCGDELPLSFWLAHWPSYIAYQDHVPAKSEPEVQRRMAARATELMRSGMLRYFGSYGINRLFLEQEGIIHNGNDEAGSG